MCMGSSDAGDQARQQQAKQEASIESGMTQINNAFAGYDQPFFNNIAQQYQQYAGPQLQQQYGQQVKGLDFNMGERGLLNSGAGANMSSLLGQQLALQQQGVVDSGRQQSQQLQQQVGQEKNNLVGQLQSSVDPNAIAQGALGRASQFNAPPVFAPVGNFFSNWASLYGANQQANAYNSLLNGSILNRGGGGGFAPLGNSSSTIR